MSSFAEVARGKSGIATVQIAHMLLENSEMSVMIYTLASAYLGGQPYQTWIVKCHNPSKTTIMGLIIRTKLNNFNSGVQILWNTLIKVARLSLGEGYQKRKPGVQS